MTKEQKAAVLSMRAQNMKYREIAERLGVSVNTVKSYCLRQVSSQEKKNHALKAQCDNCGMEIKTTSRNKNKRFCSDKCRNEWWKNHPDDLNKKAFYTHQCKHCGISFIAYGNDRRKYCSHECYINDRFGGGAHE